MVISGVLQLPGSRHGAVHSGSRLQQLKVDESSEVSGTTLFPPLSRDVSWSELHGQHLGLGTGLAATCCRAQPWALGSGRGAPHVHDFSHHRPGFFHCGISELLCRR